MASRFGEKIVIQNVQNDLRAEDIVRAIAVASDNMVGVADHANVGKVIKESLIPDMITYAQEIGQILRETKEKGADVAEAIADAKDGKILFKGAVTDFPWETDFPFPLCKRISPPSVSCSSSALFKGCSVTAAYRPYRISIPSVTLSGTTTT